MAATIALPSTHRDQGALFDGWNTAALLGAVLSLATALIILALQ